MLLRRKGLPEEGDLVWCTVTKIYHHSVFAKMEEYNKDGMIHISEISPGRIRNIRDYVDEGRKIVCKVLAVRLDKGQVDLSLRRVNEMQRKSKLEDIKHEQLAEKIIENVAFLTKQKTLNLYVLLARKLLNHYDYLYDAFLDVVKGNLDLNDLGLDAKTEKHFLELIGQRIHLPKVEINGELNLKTMESDGVTILRKIFTDLKKVKEFGIKYKGGGVYTVYINSKDYVQAEKILADGLKIIEKGIKNKGEFEFIKKK